MFWKMFLSKINSNTVIKEKTYLPLGTLGFKSNIFNIKTYFRQDFFLTTKKQQKHFFELDFKHVSDKDIKI